jgi:uncharacterized protein YecE (DUF72 family)
MLRVGTCGWTYKDWIGPFYPQDIRDMRGKWLEYYGEFFRTVEIDSTYYSVPGERTVAAWIAKGKRIGDFDFSLKMHRDVTHSKILQDAKEAAGKAKDFEDKIIKPLAENNLLGAVLIQLSPRFKKHGPPVDNNVDTLRTVLDALKVDDYDYVVEFRHRSWLDESGKEYVGELSDMLKERNVAVCIIDSPYFPRTKEATANHSYVRFHGRNFDIWWKKEKDVTDHRINRYDYFYSNEELDKWVPKLKEMDSVTDKTRVYFNNHGKAKAAKNGFYLMDELGIPHKKKDIHIREQFTLESF